MNYFEEEIMAIVSNFDLTEVLCFQREHDVQIIRGGDFQYVCYIDKIGYCPSLTPMYALVFGIKQFKQINK